MKNIIILVWVLTALFTACTPYPTDEVFPPPVISFYRGNASLGQTSTFIYSDTSLHAYQSERVLVQFAAAAGIKEVLVKNMDQVFADENFEEHLRFNHEVSCTQPLKTLPYTQVYTFEVTDLQGQTATDSIVIHFY